MVLLMILPATPPAYTLFEAVASIFTEVAEHSVYSPELILPANAPAYTPSPLAVISADLPVP